MEMLSQLLGKIVISDYHICVGLMVAMHGCYLLDGVLSASPGGTQAYV